MSAPRAAIFGCDGLMLSADERAFFREADPLGVILFARNVKDPAQLARLTGEIRQTLGRAAPILIDQEGGRVQRLRLPHWRDWEDPGATVRRIGAGPAQEALRLRMILIGRELRAAGIDVDCAPCLDLNRPETTEAIGDRALSEDPATVIRLGGAMRDGLEAAGVHAVIKHLPGHGRATVDSHEALPRVAADKQTLLSEAAPFRAHAETRWGMTAHLAFDALDPDAPATMSAAALRFVREELGFRGLLVSDDLYMHALEGPIPARAAAALKAGCDVALSCHGPVAERAEVAALCPPLEGESLRRAERACAPMAALEFDETALLARLRELDAGPVGDAHA